jgi:hypothetical protein
MVTNKRGIIQDINVKATIIHKGTTYTLRDKRNKD